MQFIKKNDNQPWFKQASQKLKKASAMTIKATGFLLLDM